jgi:2-amino-4-hydroxy-6-hydroxymethyldihydropteridine diphosphokinase
LLKKKVYLSLGSNLGDREANLRNALRELRGADFVITRISSLYETRPMYVEAQPWFLNIVVEAESHLFPMRLLLRIHNTERKLHRKRLVLNGPRTIDIDILFHGHSVVDTPTLQIPHPRLTERRFVLEPLYEIAPELRHPQTRRTVKDLLAEVSGQNVRKIGKFEFS